VSAYFTAEEQQELERAAAVQRVSLSSFLASTALHEARKINSLKK